MMVGSMVILLAGLLGLAVFGLLPLVLGGVALARINKSGGQLRGRGLAIAAMVMGGLVLLGAPVLLVAGLFFFAKVSAGESLERAEQRAMREHALANEEAARRAELAESNDPAPAVAAPLERSGSLVLDIDIEGEYRIGGVRLDAAELEGRLRREATAAGTDRDGLSNLQVRLHGEAGTPYSAVQDAMMACMEAKVWRLSFAAGGKPPRPYSLPRDAGPPRDEGLTTEGTVRQLDEIVLKVGVEKGRPDTPAFRIRDWKTSSADDLAARLKQLRQIDDLPVVIDGTRDCPFRFIIEALDACAAAGLSKVEFWPPPAAGDEPHYRQL